jgi:hypothetical protein
MVPGRVGFRQRSVASCRTCRCGSGCDGVFDAAAAGGVIFTAASGLDATAIAQVQAQVRRRLLRAFVRRGLLPGDDARATDRPAQCAAGLGAPMFPRNR